MKNKNKILHCRNRKFIEKGKNDTHNTPQHDRSLSWLGTITSIKNDGVKLVLWVQICLLFVDHCLSFCTFSFDYCVFCSSSIYGLWLPF